MGGGVRVWGKLIGHDWDSKISDNQAPNGGGISVPDGELDFSGSHVIHNQATINGGGIHVYEGGVLNFGAQATSTKTLPRWVLAFMQILQLSNQARWCYTATPQRSFGGGIYLNNGSVLTGNQHKPRLHRLCKPRFEKEQSCKRCRIIRR